jgi:farnesyl diphosphate synthase
MDTASTDFSDQLAAVAAEIEALLGRVLTAAPAPGEIARPERLLAAMRLAMLGGGKRLRPFLLLETATLFGATHSGALLAGAALECLHGYSLVHDDLPAMDDDALRRGRPTVHVAFGEATAILAGDALLTIAFEILSGERTHADPAIRAELVHLLAKASGWRGMAQGQARDLAVERQRYDAAYVAAMQALKTGALFQFACEAGAVLGRADAPARAALKRYAASFGQAFQLADDLLDTEGDVKLTGKAVAKDADRGKATLVALLGVQTAHARLHELVQEAETALAPFGSEAEKLREAARFIAERRG